MKYYFFLIQSLWLIMLSIMVHWGEVAQEDKYLSHTNFIDGPYLFHHSDGITLKRLASKKNNLNIQEECILSSALEDFSFMVSVGGMPNESFRVYLHPTLEIPDAVYPATTKLLAISDLEGKFYAFKALLQKWGVMDSNYQWTYGKGHLVLVGDFFDRGNQVTELLWLIYELDRQAKIQGGQVHFLLGNHEIMNLNGTTHYTDAKYLKVAKKMNVNYPELFGTNTELGRWLRTKNTIEKIGTDLFVHGGLSKKLIQTGLSMIAINENVRDHIGLTYDEIYAKDKATITIFGTNGPLWYRGNIASYQQIKSELKSVLLYFGGTKIIIGHTPLKDDIHLLAKGQVINIDVMQPSKKSANRKARGLLKKGEAYFKIDEDGGQVKL